MTGLVESVQGKHPCIVPDFTLLLIDLAATVALSISIFYWL